MHCDIVKVRRPLLCLSNSITKLQNNLDKALLEASDGCWITTSRTFIEGFIACQLTRTGYIALTSSCDRNHFHTTCCSSLALAQNVLVLDPAGAIAPHVYVPWPQF